MLKKASHIVLTLVLLVATTGLTISKHYCENELKSVKLFAKAKSCCNGPCNCCHNESFTIKVSDDFSATSFDFGFSQLAVDVPVVFPLFFDKIAFTPEILALVNDLPPPPIQTVLSSLQTYLL